MMKSINMWPGIFIMVMWVALLVEINTTNRLEWIIGDCTLMVVSALFALHTEDEK